MTSATAAAANAAVRHILESPALADRCGGFVSADRIDWAGLFAESAGMSGGQRLLVNVAHELWAAEGAIGVSELARRLDQRQFDRVVTAIRIFRGEEHGEPVAGLRDAA